MKPLLITMRIIFVGIFWSVFFLEGIRVIMLKNWRFDIIRSSHWEYAWDLWLSGWVINDAKEWAFVLIILTFIPLWLTGWAALSLIAWEKYIIKGALFPWNLIKQMLFQQVKVIATNTGIKKIKKKKSYKEIRPKSIRPPMDENIYKMRGTPQPTLAASSTITPLPSAAPLPAVKEEKETKFDHSLFKFDEDDDFDFDFDAFDSAPKTPKEETPEVKETPAPIKDSKPKERDKNKKEKDKNKNNNRNQPQPTPAATSKTPGNSTLEIIKQKGYEVINGITIKNNLIDFIGVADKQLCLCLIDKEPGDWLADEERFNDEEPLWFSESSHRISPVRKADVSRQFLMDKLANADIHLEVKAYVVVQIGNIINAEDMFEIWDDLGVNVTRIDRGTPKELRLFAKTLDEAIEPVSKDKLEKIKKIVRGLA